MEEIKYFLSRYKDGEKGKFMEVGKVLDKKAAELVIEESYKLAAKIKS